MTKPAAEAPESEHVQRRRILVIDDEVAIARVMGRLVRDYDIVHAPRAHEALELLAHEEFAVVFCDLRMPGIDGIDLYGIVERSLPPLQERFVFVTGGTCTPRARDFLDGITNYCMEKPFSAAELRAVVAATATRTERRRAQDRASA